MSNPIAGEAGELQTLVVERHAGVVTVVMSRPGKKNAGNPAMWRESAEAFTEIGRTRDYRFEQAPQRENHAQANNITGDEAKEAKAAFLEKREPVFCQPLVTTSAHA